MLTLFLQAQGLTLCMTLAPLKDCLKKGKAAERTYCLFHQHLKTGSLFPTSVGVEELHFYT